MFLTPKAPKIIRPDSDKKPEKNAPVRPAETAQEPPKAAQEPPKAPEQETMAAAPEAIPTILSATGVPTSAKTIYTKSLSDIPFADIWLTPEKIAYVRDINTAYALVPFQSDDLDDFWRSLEQGYTGSSSYSLRFAGESYRVERVLTLTGIQFNCRKMPHQTPDIYALGLPKPIVDLLVGLAPESGLILLSGPTGMGKTTTASSLLSK